MQQRQLLIFFFFHSFSVLSPSHTLKSVLIEAQLIASFKVNITLFAYSFLFQTIIIASWCWLLWAVVCNWKLNAKAICYRPVTTSAIHRQRNCVSGVYSNKWTGLRAVFCSEMDRTTCSKQCTIVHLFDAFISWTVWVILFDVWCHRFFFSFSFRMKRHQQIITWGLTITIATIVFVNNTRNWDYANVSHFVCPYIFVFLFFRTLSSC